jgi:hypothetical protein
MSKEMEADYEKYILDFAQLAQNENIELFCFGTELETLLQNALNTGHS